MEGLLALIRESDGLLGYLILGLCAGLEYVCPPFPGDTVVLLGGVLVVAGDWSWLGVMVATLVGSVLGAWCDYRVGRWLVTHPEHGLARWLNDPKRAPTRQRVLDAFERHGTMVLAVNRFMPGIRAFFFVVAGMAQRPQASVLAWGALSAALWNVLVIAAGIALGGQLDRMQTLLSQYTLGVWLILATLVLGMVVRAWHRRRRGAATTHQQANEAEEGVTIKKRTTPGTKGSPGDA